MQFTRDADPLLQVMTLLVKVAMCEAMIMMAVLHKQVNCLLGTCLKRLALCLSHNLECFLHTHGG